MGSLSYGIGAFDRASGQLPDLTLINLYAESARTSEGQICLQSRPGLTTLATNGAGPVRAIFSERGVLSGDDFSVIGSGASPTLYRGTTLLGTLTNTGSGAISIAGSKSEILITGGGTLYSYNGTNLTAPFTVGNTTDDITAVAFIGSLFCAIEASSARIYWSTPLDGRTWDALDFFTAERKADNALDLYALNDKLLLDGQGTDEVWAHTGDSALPFTRIEGIGSQEIGIIATGASVGADNTRFHIGSDAVVYRFAEVFERVSDHWLEEKITVATEWAMFAYKLHGHEFVCVRLNGTSGTTWAYDCATREWHELQTNGGQFIGACAAMKDTTVYLGHQSTGAIMGFSGWLDLAATLERTFTAAAALDEPLSINNVRLWANVGQAPTGITPTVSCSYSRDAGNNYTSKGSVSLGNATDNGSADYRVRPRWNCFGQFDDPGVMLKFTCSSACPFRVSAVKFNEKGGGRSRA